MPIGFRTRDRAHGNGRRTRPSKLDRWEEFVTPDRARELLRKLAMPRNRRPNHGWIRQIAHLMDIGEWYADQGEDIQLTANGGLLNGQHRLQAIILRDRGAWLSFARGVPKARFATIDGGRPRAAKDDLYIAGVEDSTNVSSIARLLLVWDSHKRLRSQASIRPSRQVIRRYAEEHASTISKALHVADRLRRVVPGGPAPWGALHVILGRLDPDLRDEYFARLQDGLGFDRGSPIQAVREALFLLRQRLRPQDQIALEDLQYLAVIGWNLLRDGKKAARIRVWNALPEKARAKTSKFPIPY